MKHLLFVFLSLLVIACQSKKESQGFENILESIDLDGLDTKGLLTLNKQQLIPNEIGILAEIKLVLPKYQKGIY